MKQVSTLLLKIAVIILGIPVLAIGIFVLPRVFSIAFQQAVANGAVLGYIVLTILLVMYIAMIPFYTALYQTFNLLNFIDRNLAFSQDSVLALKKIKNCGKIISGLYVVILPLVFVVAEWDDAPGLIVINLVFIGASFLVAVFAAVLQRLLQQAIEIKEENDLTV